MVFVFELLVSLLESEEELLVVEFALVGVLEVLLALCFALFGFVELLLEEGEVLPEFVFEGVGVA